MVELTSRARNPWVALALSLLCPGLGHVYAGRIAAGLVLFLASLAFTPVVLSAALVGPSTLVLLGLLAAGAAVLGVYFYAAVGAFVEARRHRDYEPREYNRIGVYALFVFVGLTYPAANFYFLRANVFEAFYLPTASEAPNFLAGDHILANKLILQRRPPDRGDVVVFHVPTHREQNWIKRIVGMPGDTIEIKDGRLILNGEPVPRTPADADAGQGRVFTESLDGRTYPVLMSETTDAALLNYPAARVPSGACFMLGDNRTNSTDSREFGFVPLGEVFGLAQYIYWPAGSWKRFGAYRPG